MGQSWLFEIMIEPKKGKFKKVSEILTDMAIPYEEFKEQRWDEDKESNTIEITGGTYAGYGYGDDFVNELKDALSGLIEEGTVNIWWGDQPQETKKLVEVM